MNDFGQLASICQFDSWNQMDNSPNVKTTHSLTELENCVYVFAGVCEHIDTRRQGPKTH